MSLAAAALAPAAVADARIGSCRPDGTGPVCHVWSGKVTFVADGDTLDVDLDGGPLIRVRMVGIQAMELSRYSKYRNRRRGDCHGVAAANRLDDLVKASKRRARVLAQNPASRAGSRLRRLLQLRRGGQWVDATTILLEEGHGLWDPGHGEWGMNGIHHAVAARGIAAARHLYDPVTCGAGPSGGAPLELRVNWDAAHNDAENVNGEFVRVANGGAEPVPIGGWWIRDSALRRFTFPSGAAIPPGDAVTMHVGQGTADGSDFFWGLPEPAFENAVGLPRSMGDGAYLFDPEGDLRAFDVYGG